MPAAIRPALDMSTEQQEQARQPLAAAAAAASAALPQEQGQQPAGQPGEQEEGGEVDYISPAQVGRMHPCRRLAACSQRRLASLASFTTNCVRHLTSPQYYHSRDVALRLKHQDELRRRSGPEAPGSPRHSRAAAGEAARQRGLGETREQEEVRAMWQLGCERCRRLMHGQLRL